jgi:hypothetical protein
MFMSKGHLVYNGPPTALAAHMQTISKDALPQVSGRRCVCLLNDDGAAYGAAPPWVLLVLARWRLLHVVEGGCAASCLRC